MIYVYIKINHQWVSTQGPVVCFQAASRKQPGTQISLERVEWGICTDWCYSAGMPGAESL